MMIVAETSARQVEADDIAAAELDRRLKTREMRPDSGLPAQFGDFYTDARE